MYSPPPANLRQAATEIVVATDGSSLGNPGPGAWGWYVDENRWAAGAQNGVTNNQMELTAIAEALEALPADQPVLIQADSVYAIDAVTKWIHGWKRRGWKTSSGGDVANREIIERIDTLLRGRQVRFEHVRGHAGHALNEAVDAKARGASEALKAGRAVDSGPGWRGQGAHTGAGDDSWDDGRWSGQGSLFGL